MLVSGVVARFASDLESDDSVKSNFLWMRSNKGEEEKYSSVEVPSYCIDKQQIKCHFNVIVGYHSHQFVGWHLASWALHPGVWQAQLVVLSSINGRLYYWSFSSPVHITVEGSLWDHCSETKWPPKTGLCITACIQAFTKQSAMLDYF